LKSKLLSRDIRPTDFLNIVCPEKNYKDQEMSGQISGVLFNVTLEVEDNTFAGQGPTRKKAKTDAAEKAIRFLVPSCTSAVFVGNRSEADEVTTKRRKMDRATVTLYFVI